jgi:hypothetical protein
MNIPPVVANKIISRIGGYAVVPGAIIGRIRDYAVILGSGVAIVCPVLVTSRKMRDKWNGGNARNHGGKKDEKASKLNSKKQRARRQQKAREQ